MEQELCNLCEKCHTDFRKRKDSVAIDVKDGLSRLSVNLSFGEQKYKMNHPKRGKAIIFNHFRFGSTYGERKGTNEDVINLKKALLTLGFNQKDIIIHKDLKAGDIAYELKKVQEEDHTQNDLLMVFVLTHGRGEDKISAYDVEYPVETLWEPFRADNCKTLAGKPKIFFVVACRGDSVDLGERLLVKPETEVDARPFQCVPSYCIPVWSDFLYVFSTYKGYFSYRNVNRGTWYIQAFCDELAKTNKLKDRSFVDFLTAVNGRLSALFETGNSQQTMKQISIFSSTLTKSLHFETCEKKCEN